MWKNRKKRVPKGTRYELKREDYTRAEVMIAIL